MFIKFPQYLGYSLVNWTVMKNTSKMKYFEEIH